MGAKAIYRQSRILALRHRVHRRRKECPQTVKLRLPPGGRLCFQIELAPALRVLSPCDCVQKILDWTFATP